MVTNHQMVTYFQTCFPLSTIQGRFIPNVGPLLQTLSLWVSNNILDTVEIRANLTTLWHISALISCLEVCGVCQCICNAQEHTHIQYIPRNMHTVFALLCFVVVIHWLIFPYPSGLLHWHCGNLTIAPVPAKQPWWIWINTSCEFIMNDCITTTKQSTTKPCAYFLGYTVHSNQNTERCSWFLWLKYVRCEKMATLGVGVTLNQSCYYGY